MLRRFALLLTVLTGATGLVYQVAWQKYLATLLGSHSEATAAVLAIFLAGMSVGYSQFGRLSAYLVATGEADGARGRLLWAYGLIEAGIGVFALLFPYYFAFVRSISGGLPPGATGLGFVIDVGLAAALIGPAAVLMGGTVPLLTQALSRDLEDATRLHALVYALNTAGAFAGALAGGFALVPWLGLVRVMFAMGALNLIAGAGFVWMSRRMARPTAEAPLLEVEDGMPVVARSGAYASVGLLVGFAMMAIQTIMNRIGALSFGSSAFTFSTVVAVTVLCIALGSLAVTRWRSVPSRALLANQWLLFGSFFGLYFVLDQSPYWIHVLRIQFGTTDSAFYLYYLSGLVVMLVVLGPPIMLSGAVLPLLFHTLRQQTGDLGALAGRIYSWNTVGSLLGALLGGYALLFFLDLHHVYRIAVGALGAAALLVTVLTGALSRDRTAGLGIFLVALLMLPQPWSPRLLTLGLFRSPEDTEHSYQGPSAAEARGFMGLGGEVVFYDDDPTLSAAVVEVVSKGLDRSRSIVNNGKNDSSTDSDYPTLGMLAVLPSVLVGEPRNVFIIGYGTGITVGEFTRIESIEQVVVAEISQGVIEAAPLFDAWTFGASSNPRVEIRRSDAYRALVRSAERFDVISSEPSNPWVNGVEMLYSREFLEAARARLTPDGVFAQWIHVYEMDDASLELVLRTYRSVFDRVAVWYGLGDDLILLGFNRSDASYSLEDIENQLAKPPVKDALARSGIVSVLEFLVHELLPPGAVGSLELEGPFHTLLHPILGHMAGRAFFRGEHGDVPFAGYGETLEEVASSSLLRRHIERDGPLSKRERLEVTSEACSHRQALCSALLADWYRVDPRSRSLELLLSSMFKPGFIFHKAPQRNRFREVAKLLRDGPMDGELDPIVATQLWHDFYTPNVDFDAERVIRAWKTCPPPHRDSDCEDGLEQTQRMLREGAKPSFVQ